MRVWRLTRPKFAATAFSGLGGLHADGRWHRRGQRIVYTSETLSLALLEVLVHLEPAQLPAQVSVEAVVPDECIESLDEARLPDGWRAVPAPPEVQALGAAWLDSLSSVALRVPSAIVPQQSNVLINPAHADVARIEVAEPVAFSFDPRLR